LPALPAAVLSQSTAPQPLLIYRSGQLIGVFIPIDAELWSGAGDGEYASYDLQSTASRVGSDLAFDWYSNIFDSQLGSEALARQIAHSHRRFRIDPQDNKPK
jgi:hypothetical protein